MYEKEKEATGDHDVAAGLPELRSGSNEVTTVFPSGIRNSAPFIASHDIPRGVMFAVQAALQYTFMLVVMCVSIYLYVCMEMLMTL